jgi:hypothetical protein
VQFGQSAKLQHSGTPTPRPPGFEHSLSVVADGSGRDPLRVGLALVLRSFSEGGSEAALHEIAAWRRRKDDDEDENDVPGEWRQEIIANGIDFLTRSYRAGLVPLSGHVFFNTKPRG